MPDFKAHGYGYVELAKVCISYTPITAIESLPLTGFLTMPPRLNLFTASAAVFRPASSNQSVSRRSITSLLNANRSSAVSSSANGLKPCLPQTRYSSSNSKGKDDAAKVPEEPLPHVSEEAAEVANIMNKKCDGSAPASPELEQGTPISEVSF